MRMTYSDLYVKMLKYSNSDLQKKLKFLKSTQNAIQSLSIWCIKRHRHYKSIITIWFNTIKKMKIEKRLSLFYLANHVIQYSKKKKYTCIKFVDGWKTVIKKAIPYVRYDQIQSKISRIIKIWEERSIYNVSYLTDLTSLLTTPIQKLKLTGPVQEIQRDAIAVKLHSCVKLQQNNNLMMKNLTEAILPFTNHEAIKNVLKDLTRSQELLNNSMSKIESFIKCIKQEATECDKLIDTLEVAKLNDDNDYDDKNSEIKMVAQAYPNYTNKVQLPKSKLESLDNSMPIDIPMPSSDIDVPSTSTSSVSIEDINKHNTNYKTELNSDNCMMNSSMRNDINDTDIDVSATTVMNNIKSYITLDVNTNVQVSSTTTEDQDLQLLTNQLPYDAPPKFSNNIVPPTNLSFRNENTIPVTHVTQIALVVTLHSDRSTCDIPVSPHGEISNQNTKIISKTNGGPGIDQCVLAPKIIDKEEASALPSVFKPLSPPDLLMEAVSNPLEDNAECIDMDLSDDENPKSNHDQKHILLFPPPFPPSLPPPLPPTPPPPLPPTPPPPPPPSPSPPMSFAFDHQNVPYVTYQRSHPSQPWSNERPNFNEVQWNTGQYDQWKHNNQSEQHLRFSKYNPSQTQCPQHFQKIQPIGDFSQKWKRAISNWSSRDPRLSIRPSKLDFLLDNNNCKPIHL